MKNLPVSGKELRTLVKNNGALTLNIQEFPIPQPKAHEIVVRIEGSLYACLCRANRHTYARR